MSNGWLDGMGAVAGVLLGIAIPAQEAMRARMSINTVLVERMRETTDAFDAAMGLAQQALRALNGNVQRDAYFAGTYNRTRIEHTLKRLDALADDAPPRNAVAAFAAFAETAMRARISARNFFNRLNAASDSLDVAARSPQTLRDLFDRLTDDLCALHAARERVVDVRRIGTMWKGVSFTFWNTR
jgi:hypothetical protein